LSSIVTGTLPFVWYGICCQPYATAHIDAQILILRHFIASLRPLPSKALISAEHMRRLTDVRRDIVHTIRQVVDVVSKYAGGAFPEPAKNRVRRFILGLLHRWVSKAGSSTGFAASAATASERERGVVSAGGTVAAAASGTGAAVRRGQQKRAAQREHGAGVDTGFRSSPSSRAPSPSASSSPRNSWAPLTGNTAEGDYSYLRPGSLANPQGNKSRHLCARGIWQNPRRKNDHQYIW